MDSTAPSTYVVPQCLERLVRRVTRAFYDASYIAIVDALVRDKCVKEQDLSELLQMDKKTASSSFSRLVKDKIIAARQLEDPNEERDPLEKPEKYNYWFISYEEFVAALKVRLDVMRKKIVDTKSTGSEKTYKCISCGVGYSDLDVIDLMQGDELECMNCGGTVAENEQAVEALAKGTQDRTKRMLDQLAPLYKELVEVDKITLSEKILRPAPTRRRIVRGRRAGMLGPRRERDTGDTYFGDVDQKVVVNLGDSKQQVKKKQRIMPWLNTSTVVDNGQAAAGSDSDGEEQEDATMEDLEQPPTDTTEDIMAMLSESKEEGGGEGKGGERGEEKAENDVIEAVPQENKAYPSSSGEESSDEEDEIYIQVGDEKVPLLEVQDSHKAKMTPEEMKIYTTRIQAYYEEEYG